MVARPPPFSSISLPRDHPGYTKNTSPTRNTVVITSLSTPTKATTSVSGPRILSSSTSSPSSALSPSSTTSVSSLTAPPVWTPTSSRPPCNLNFAPPLQDNLPKLVHKLKVGNGSNGEEPPVCNPPATGGVTVPSNSLSLPTIQNGQASTKPASTESFPSTTETRPQTTPQSHPDPPPPPPPPKAHDVINSRTSTQPAPVGPQEPTPDSLTPIMTAIGSTPHTFSADLAQKNPHESNSPPVRIISMVPTSPSAWIPYFSDGSSGSVTTILPASSIPKTNDPTLTTSNTDSTSPSPHGHQNTRPSSSVSPAPTDSHSSNARSSTVNAIIGGCVAAAVVIFVLLCVGGGVYLHRRRRQKQTLLYASVAHSSHPPDDSYTSVGTAAPAYETILVSDAHKNTGEVQGRPASLVNLPREVEHAASPSLEYASTEADQPRKSPVVHITKDSSSSSYHSANPSPFPDSDWESVIEDFPKPSNWQSPSISESTNPFRRLGFIPNRQKAKNTFPKPSTLLLAQPSERTSNLERGNSKETRKSLDGTILASQQIGIAL